MIERLDAIIVEALAWQDEFARGARDDEPNSLEILARLLDAVREPTPAMCRRGSAMWLDTSLAPGHPERNGKFSNFELNAAECWRTMVDFLKSETGA